MFIYLRKIDLFYIGADSIIIEVIQMKYFTSYKLCYYGIYDFTELHLAYKESLTVLLLSVNLEALNLICGPWSSGGQLLA